MSLGRVGGGSGFGVGIGGYDGFQDVEGDGDVGMSSDDEEEQDVVDAPLECVGIVDDSFFWKSMAGVEVEVEIAPVNILMNNTFCGTQQSREKKQSKMEQSGLTEEELLRQQEELFGKARDKYNQTTTQP